jgi:hypothetical protein
MLSLNQILEEEAGALLRLPGSAAVVVEIGNVEGDLIAHRELTHHPGGVRSIDVEIAALHSQRFAKELIKPGGHRLGAAEQFHQAGDVVLDEPGIGPAVVLVEVVAEAESTGGLGATSPRSDSHRKNKNPSQLNARPPVGLRPPYAPALTSSTT